MICISPRRCSAPAARATGVTPARALGLTFLPIASADRKLDVTLTAPVKAVPETKATVRVKVDGAQGKQATVTLSAVDVGILNINQYKTPDPLDYFFRQAPLRARTAGHVRQADRENGRHQGQAEVGRRRRHARRQQEPAEEGQARRPVLRPGEAERPGRSRHSAGPARLQRHPAPDGGGLHARQLRQRRHRNGGGRAHRGRAEYPALHHAGRPGRHRART